MNDAECVRFLQWALPRLRLRWAGFRRVRGQVCKRLARRLREAGLPGLDAYRARLERDPSEWARLDALCRITISRFYRDRAVLDAVCRDVLPALARGAVGRGARTLRCWSAGCASGEEPYTLAIAWDRSLAGEFPGLALSVLATDADAVLLERARAASYPSSAVRDLPDAWRRSAFELHGSRYVLAPRLRRGVEFRHEDLRAAAPAGPFDLVACRNLAFTYFDEALQGRILERIAAALVPGGALVVGSRETPARAAEAFAPWGAARGIYRRLPGRAICTE